MTDSESRSSDALIAELKAALGEDVVLTGDDVTARAGDGSGTAPCAARAVLRPRTTEQLSAALEACNRAGQPVVPQGGLTGLVGGGVAGDLEVAITLERMTAIEEIDPVGRTMTVQAGAALQEAHRRREQDDQQDCAEQEQQDAAHLPEGDQHDNDQEGSEDPAGSPVGQ